MTTDTAQTDGSGIMTFHPSKEDFKDFSRYIAYMESQGAHKAGMARVSIIFLCNTQDENKMILSFHVFIIMEL